MRSRRRPILLVLGLAAVLATAGCGPRRQLRRLVNGDGTLVAIIDDEKANFGLTRDAAVSLEEKGGIATSVATFNNVQTLEVTWLGPQDLNICQTGAVIGYKTSVPLNTSTGIRTVYVHYSC